MAAEALASELGMSMYRVDLSQILNKYVGETEKNLKRIFGAVEVCDWVRLFDEADALFGKRAEVKDPHYHFSDMEITYLLERMERFKGLVVLPTNLRKDLDEAFTRRLRRGHTKAGSGYPRCKGLPANHQSSPSFSLGVLRR